MGNNNVTRKGKKDPDVVKRNRLAVATKTTHKGRVSLALFSRLPPSHPYYHKEHPKHSLFPFILISRVTIITFFPLWTLQHREVKRHAQDHTTNKVSEPRSSHLALVFFPIIQGYLSQSHHIWEIWYSNYMVPGLRNVALIYFELWHPRTLLLCLEQGSFTHLKDMLYSLIISAHYPFSEPNQKKKKNEIRKLEQSRKFTVL